MVLWAVASVTIVEELNIGDLLSSINVSAVNFFFSGFVCSKRREKDIEDDRCLC